MFTYDTFQKANNKGADQTARMRRLVCAFVVRNPPKTGFLALGPSMPLAFIALIVSIFEKGVILMSSKLSNFQLSVH